MDGAPTGKRPFDTCNACTDLQSLASTSAAAQCRATRASTGPVPATWDGFSPSQTPCLSQALQGATGHYQRLVSQTTLLRILQGQKGQMVRIVILCLEKIITTRLLIASPRILGQASEGGSAAVAHATCRCGILPYCYINHDRRH
jgi:hypothetical protein